MLTPELMETLMAAFRQRAHFLDAQLKAITAEARVSALLSDLKGEE